MRLFTAGAAALTACMACSSPTKTPTPKESKQGEQIQYVPDGCSYTVTTVAGTRNAMYRVESVPATVPPIHVHATFAADPSAGFAVDWQSEPAGDPEVSPAASLTQLFYGTSKAAVEAATAATAATADVKVQDGHTFDYDSVLEGTRVRIHEVHVCGLKAQTTYFYKVGNTGAFSPVYSLTTAPALGSTAPFRFGVAGDSRDIPALWSTAQKKFSEAGVAFQLFTGDAVALGDMQSKWDAWFENADSGMAASDGLASMPILMTNGNHESLAIPYLAQFALPQQPGGGEARTDGLLDSTKAWYSLNYGNVHIVSLNDTASEATLAAQATWLDADLTKVDRAKTPWIFVFHHRPEYSCDTAHGSELDVRDAWTPIYDKHHVDAVFNGHVHNYQRSLKIAGGAAVADNGQGTIYVVAAAVGAPLYGLKGSECDDVALFPTVQTENKDTYKVQNYVTVDVSGNSLHLTGYNIATGAVIDDYQLTK